MKPPKSPEAGSRVPSGRLSRLARMGGMAGGIAGGMLVDGVRQMATGKRPSLGGLLLTPANALRVTQNLAQMRGAAMKVGQLLSMDAGDLLPPELTDILARLRSDADPMPDAQLRAVLSVRWGKSWPQRFASFSPHPIAAASIGQVHRATTADGRDLAIKIQYPGVRDSIDSDVNNVAALIRLSGLMPATLDIGPLLAEAKRQLHAEADYAREGQWLSRFGALLDGDGDYRVPALHPDFCTPSILAMSFVDSVPVETLVTAPQAERDRVATLLIGLVLREVFAFRLMQTDPNFANYRYDPATQALVLLDFGATQEISVDLADQHRHLMRAGLAGDQPAIWSAITGLGLMPPDAAEGQRETALAVVADAFAPLRSGGVVDFATLDLARHIRAEGMEIASDRTLWHIPPPATLFLQRKFGGIYLLCSRLRARVDVGRLIAPYR